jgi:hypothetical protein
MAPPLNESSFIQMSTIGVGMCQEIPETIRYPERNLIRLLLYSR